MFGSFKCFCCSASKLFKSPDGYFHCLSSLFAGSKIFSLVYLVVETVEHEVQKIRNYSFCAFCFEKIYKMIVSSRSELDKDLTYDTNPWLNFICDLDVIKIFNHQTTHLLEFNHISCNIYILFRYKFSASCKPLLMNFFNRTLDLLIRTHSVDTSHHDISEYSTVCSTLEHLKVYLESWIGFELG